jgi:hypothetical protein
MPPSIIQRIENEIPFLEHLQFGSALSLTEMTYFLRGGLLETWCELSYSQRHQVVSQVNRQEKGPPRLSYMIGRKAVVVVECRTSKDKMLCAVLVLEALRRLLARCSELEAIQVFHKEMIQGHQISFGPIPSGAIQHLCNQTTAAAFKFQNPRKPRIP